MFSHSRLAFACPRHIITIGRSQVAHLFDKEYTREQLLEKVDDMSQVAGVRPARLQQGPEDGVQVIDFWTGSGLSFTVVPSRGMDISAATYNGQSLCPRAHSREVHPAFFELGAEGWRRGFFEGWLTTCGPIFYTTPPRDAELRPIGHGRATWTPARNVSCDEMWEGDEYYLSARGRMREDALVWERRISTRLGSTALLIQDRVENQGPQPINHRFQYHINAGFPVVDEGAEFSGSSLGLYGREGENVSPEFRRIEAPSLTWRGRTHDELMCADDDGYAYAAMVNRAFGDGEGFGYYVRYKLDTLPYFFLWKSMLAGRYIVGTEPASHKPVNSFDPHAEGLEPTMPGEVREYEIELGVLHTRAQIEGLDRRMAGVVSSYRVNPAPERVGTTHSGRHGF